MHERKRTEPSVWTNSFGSAVGFIGDESDTFDNIIEPNAEDFGQCHNGELAEVIAIDDDDGMTCMLSINEDHIW